MYIWMVEKNLIWFQHKNYVNASLQHAIKTDLLLETQQMVWKLSYVSREKAFIVNENVKGVFSSEETQCHSFSAGTGHVKWYQTIGRLWWNVFVCPLCVISRTACLAVVSVGLDPARLVIPTEANLWPEGPEPFHTGSTRRRRCYGERKMYACIKTWEQLKVALCCPLMTLCLLKSSILSLSFCRSHVEKAVACPSLSPSPRLQ